MHKIFSHKCIKPNRKCEWHTVINVLLSALFTVFALLAFSARHECNRKPHGLD